MHSILINKIKEYQNITIFRHVRPDGDCMFSSLALYCFIKDNFKNKKVKLLGEEKFDLITHNDKASDSFIMNSLAIVLDVASTNRIDDFRGFAAKEVIKIDHHPKTDNYGDINIVYPEASSACQILAEILLSKDYSEYNVSNKVCEYLYCGMVTDTLNFKTANTSAKTLLIASKLMKKADLKASDLYDFINSVNLKYFNKVTKLRDMLIVKDKLGYVKLDSKQLKKLGLDPIEAKNNIDEFGNISDLNIWAFAVENNGKWDCSMRSKRTVIINQIARKYGGGGHANACAVKGIEYKQIVSLFNDLQTVSK